MNNNDVQRLANLIKIGVGERVLVDESYAQRGLSDVHAAILSPFNKDVLVEFLNTSLSNYEYRDVDELRGLVTMFIDTTTEEAIENDYIIS